MNLYIWENVLLNFGTGIMVALAPDLETARKTLNENPQLKDEPDIDKEPTEVIEAGSKEPRAWFVDGSA